MVNLLVELDERYSVEIAHATHAKLAAMGYDVSIRTSADDRTLAWIDVAFGGTWSSEAFSGVNAIASRDGAPCAFATIDPKNTRFAWLRGEAAKSGTAVFGPFGVDPALRGIHGDDGATLGELVLTLALCELRQRGYARALVAAVGDRLIAYYTRVTGAHVAERFEPFETVTARPRTVILASGSGTNAQTVLDAAAAGLPLDVVAVVTNRKSAKVIERAERAGVTCDIVVWNRAEEERARYDALLLEAVRSHQPDLVLLLGWMHLLDKAFVEAFPHLLNIHPAFLPHNPMRDHVGMPDGTTIPAFRGAHAVRDAVAFGSSWIGASFHQVTNDTDRGAVLARKPLKLEPGEDEERALERLHPIEHVLVLTGLKRWLYER